MAGTVLEYLSEYGGETFGELPFHDVDSLILSQFCYLKFDGLVPGPEERKDYVSLSQLREHPDFDRLFSDIRYEKPNRLLFERMADSRRFGELKLNYYENIIEHDTEVQFSAVTFLLPNGVIYVAFRGTDENMVGWKEDFNMTFMDVVPAQILAVKYLNEVARTFEGDFLVGGHSKGGNLSVYSAMHCEEEVRQRIRLIYSMDGPGFRREVLSQGAYLEIRDRIVKLLPQSSLVGMLMEIDDRYEVIKSNSFGLTQHNPYTWEIEGAEFVREGEIDPRAKAIDLAVNEWILGQDEENRKRFVDTVYQIFDSCEANTLIEFASGRSRNLNKVLSTLRGQDEETIRMLRRIIRNLVDLGAMHMKAEFLTEAESKRRRQSARSQELWNSLTEAGARTLERIKKESLLKSEKHLKKGSEGKETGNGENI